MNSFTPKEMLSLIKENAELRDPKYYLEIIDNALNSIIENAKTNIESNNIEKCVYSVYDNNYKETVYLLRITFFCNIEMYIPDNIIDSVKRSFDSILRSNGFLFTELSLHCYKRVDKTAYTVVDSCNIYSVISKEEYDELILTDTAILYDNKFQEIYYKYLQEPYCNYKAHQISKEDK